MDRATKDQRRRTARPQGRLMVLVLAATLGCAPAVPVDRSASLAIPDQISRAACLRAGGAQSGLLGQACTFATPDAGKLCRDGSECASGACLADAAGKTEGQCAARTTSFGCFAVVEDGRSSPMLCAD